MSINAAMGIRSSLLVLLSLGYQAVDADVFDELELHGFATQGFVKTSANSFFGDSEQGSFDFREIGVNATFEPLPNLRLSGQLLSRRAGELSSGSPNVDYALADFTLSSTADHRLAVIFGRIKNPLGLYNETRDVAFTRPSVFVPQSIYFDRVRNLLLSSDGIGLRNEWYGDSANVSVYGAAAQPLVDENVEYSYLGKGYVGDFEPHGISYVGNFSLASTDDKLRSSFSVASTVLDFDKDKSDSIEEGRLEFVYWVLSLQYATERMTLTAEYMREPVSWHGLNGSPHAGKEVEAEGYYLQGAWRLRSDLEWMIRYEEAFADRNDRSGNKMSEATFGLIPAGSLYSKIWATGLRWDISRDVMLMAEYQRNNGAFLLSSRENALSDLQEDWDLFALSVSYRF